MGTRSSFGALMWKRSYKKIVIGLLVILALAIFLPPSINGTLAKARLAPALSAALGREVKIGSVRYRLLPRPGFDLYDFRVMDDPSFSAEPVLLCGKVTADLRLTSIWRGRLEIANLHLTDDNAPPSLNLVYLKGHWNIESLMLRAEQVPSAPTARRSAGERPRFPYIGATDGRINFKVGPEKKPYALANTDFAFWLAAEDVWHLRLEGRPVRTDMNLNDTGTLRLEGDVRRSPKLREMMVKLELGWDNAQLGQFSTLISGQDKGWRGGLNANVQLSGPLADMHVVATADLNNFRRFDINRTSTPQLRTRCLGAYMQPVLDLKCDTPLDTGGAILTAHWSGANPRDYDLSLVANRVPLAVLATFAREAKRTLPENFNATGDLNAAFGFHSRKGVRDWHGTGMTSPFFLDSAGTEKPFPVSAVHFHMGLTETAITIAARRAKHALASSAAPVPDGLIIDAFSVQLGPSATLEIQGSLDGKGYWVSAKGMVPLERLLALGKATGFSSPVTNTTASAVAALNVTGQWQGFAPARLRGTAHLQNAATWITGVKDRLLISQAEAQLTDSGVVLSDINAQFEHTPIAISGSVTAPWSCSSGNGCPLQFDLRADSLVLEDAANLLGASDKGWSLPFISDSSRKLPEFRAAGTLSVGQLSLAQIPLEKFTAHLEYGDNALVVSHLAAKIESGATAGDWKMDFSNGKSRYSGTGTLSGVASDHFGASPAAALLASWLSGRTDAKYSLHFEGTDAQEILSSASGKAEITVSNGASKALSLETAKPLRFQEFQGALELERRVLRVLPSKFKAENRIYDVSGTISLADKATKLRVRNNASQWEVSGTLDNPAIAAQPLTAKTVSASKR